MRCVSGDRSRRIHRHSMERRTREEERAAKRGDRVSRDSKPEMRCTSPAEKTSVRTRSWDVIREHGKKRKERMAADRWNYHKENDHRKLKEDRRVKAEFYRSPKSKILTTASKVSSSKRIEGPNHRDGDCDLTKHKPQKDSIRVQRSAQHYKDGMERFDDLRSRGSIGEEPSPKKHRIVHSGIALDNSSQVEFLAKEAISQGKAQRSSYKSYSHHKLRSDHGNFLAGEVTDDGFNVPLYHGPPRMTQFSAPPFFGITPSVDLTHGWVSCHPHGVAERFTSHGWPNSVDQPSDPCLQMWAVSNGIQWHKHCQLLSRRWETNSEMRNWHNNNNMDIPEPKMEQESLPRVENMQIESTVAEQPSVGPYAKNAVENPQRSLTQNRPAARASTLPDDGVANQCSHYLSKIDISPDLAGPDLHEYCTALMEKLGLHDARTYTCLQAKNHATSSTTHPQNQTRRNEVFKGALSL